MPKYEVYVYYNETIEADSEFEAEQIALNDIERLGILAEEVDGPGDETDTEETNA